MKKNMSTRSDIIFEKEKLNINSSNLIQTNNCNGFIYKIINFENVNDKFIKTELKKTIQYFIDNFKLKSNFHVFIVGIGNDNHTADSIGPKTLKHILINAHLENLGIKIKYPKVSALEPGVLGETGIETKRIIESVIEEIKPDIIIVIDSYVTSNIEYLNKCIQITNEGIKPGSGLNNINTEISFKTMGIPVLVIGVPTAIEVIFENNNTYLLSTKDIDTYVIKISKIIGDAINEVLYQL